VNLSIFTYKASIEVFLVLNLKAISDLRYLPEKSSLCRLASNKRECCNSLALPSHTKKKGRSDKDR